MLEEALKGVIATGPLAVLLFYFLHLERKDRLKKEERIDLLTDRQHQVAIEIRDTLKDFNRFFEKKDQLK